MEKKLPFKKLGSSAGKPGAVESGKPQDGKAPAIKPGEKAATEKGAPKKGPVKGRPMSVKARSKAPAAAKPKKARKAPPPTTRGGIPFICSECYEEFVLPSTYERETVTCPECLHVGKRPAEDFLEKVNLHKSAEKRALAKSLAFAEMLLVGALGFIWILTPYSASILQEQQMRSNVTLGLGGLVLLLVGLLAWSVSQYEKNRWEIYF